MSALEANWEEFNGRNLRVIYSRPLQAGVDLDQDIDFLDEADVLGEIKARKEFLGIPKAPQLSRIAEINLIREIKLQKSLMDEAKTDLENASNPIRRADAESRLEAASLSYDQADLRLLGSHIGQLAKITLKYKWCGLPVRDLFHHAVIGVHEALIEFDETKGYRFLTFALPKIKKNVGEAARIEINRSHDEWNENPGIDKAEDRLTQELGKNPTLVELSLPLKMSPEKIRRLRRNKIADSLDEVSDEDDKTLHERVASETDVEQTVIQREIIDTVNQAANELTDREKVVFSLYFLLNENGAAVGKKLKLSRERIRQILSDALVKLEKVPAIKHLIDAHYPSRVLIEKSKKKNSLIITALYLGIRALNPSLPIA